MQKALALLFCFLSLVTDAQYKNIKFSNYSTTQGLSNDHVNTLFIDSRGFLWVGTWNGLNRWDGKQFSVYKHNDNLQRSLVHDFVMGVVEDSKKRVWVYTVYGLSLYRPECDGFETQKALSKAFINRMFEDRLHQLWVTGRNNISMYDYESKKLSTIAFNVDTVKDPKSNMVLASALDADTIWLAMGNGVIRKLDIKTRQSTVCGFSAALVRYSSNAACNLIYKDRIGNLWIAYQGLGIVKLDSKKHIADEYVHSADQSSIGSNDIYQCYEDTRGRMWIAAINGNLNLYLSEKNAFYRYEPNNNVEYSIKATSISCITEDRFNNIWIGSHGAGVMCINNYINQFDNYNPILLNSKTPINIVNCFYESPDKNIWIGTNDKCLVQYNPQTQETKSYFKDDGSIPNTIVDILPAGNGKLWLATWGSGLILFDPQTSKTRSFTFDAKNKNSLTGDYIKSICIDDSLLWIGCYGKGLNVLNTKTFAIKNFNNSTDDCLSKPLWPSGIFKDSKKRIWVSTFDNLYIIANAKLQTYVSKPGDIVTNSSLRAFEDNHHRIFIPTHDGLALYNEKTKTFKNVLESFGVHDLINAVAQSNDGYLWLTTDNGVLRYSFEKNSLRHYDSKDGLPCNSFSTNAILKSSNGRIYLGSLQGFSIINSRKLIQDTIAPTIYFTDFQLFNTSQKPGDKGSPLHKSIGVCDTLILNYSQSIFSVSFIGIDLLVPHKVHYAYKIEGFNNDWYSIGSENKVTFTNLRYGTYVLHVKACNCDNVWSKHEAVLTIIILPPWWETWWFKLLIIGLVVGVIVQRVIVNRKKHIVLERLVSHRTAQLTNALEELKSKNEVIESQRFEAFEKSKIITESIQYAKIIQESILPLDEEIKEVLPDYFVLYRPLNIVSGDFYWVKSNNQIQYLVVADCTGHGVPGAFMSLLGITLLNDILQDTLILSAAQILGVLRNRIKEELHQSRHKQTSRDGMDMVICVIDKQKRMIEFAGANISLIAIKTSPVLESNGKRELHEFKGDKMPVGIHEIESPFTLHSIPIDAGDIYYISSDGFRDQIGGPNDNKYGSKRYRELLLSIHTEPFSKQKKQLNAEFNIWKGNNDQIDDVTIVGFSFD